MGEVETNGGIKIVGIFGRIRFPHTIGCIRRFDAGELYFLMPGERVLVKKLILTWEN